MGRAPDRRRSGIGGIRLRASLRECTEARLGTASFRSLEFRVPLRAENRAYGTALAKLRLSLFVAIENAQPDPLSDRPHSGELSPYRRPKPSTELGDHWSTAILAVVSDKEIGYKWSIFALRVFGMTWQSIRRASVPQRRVEETSFPVAMLHEANDSAPDHGDRAAVVLAARYGSAVKRIIGCYAAPATVALFWLANAVILFARGHSSNISS